MAQKTYHFRELYIYIQTFVSHEKAGLFGYRQGLGTAALSFEGCGKSSSGLKVQGMQSRVGVHG